MTNELSTEEKIKVAAKELFHQKGYAGTKTRDIAEKAGINLALLNYYFRSKEKLFGMVMKDGVKELFTTIREELYDKEGLLSDKIPKIVNIYFEILTENPNLPLFILGELQANPDKLAEELSLPKDFLIKTVLYQQLKAQLNATGQEHIEPLQILLNILALTIFPFAAGPLLRTVTHFPDDNFTAFLEERRKLIPIWIKSMLKIEE